MSEEHPSGGPPVEIPVASPEPVAPAAPMPEPVAVPAPEPAAEPAATPAEPAPPAEEGILKVTPAESTAEGVETEPAEGAKPEPVDVEPFEFAVPDGFQVAPERLEELQGVLREAGVSSKEHAEKLWSMHTAAMQELADNAAQQQRDAWTQQTQTWRREIFSDPELGGAGYKTNQETAIRMLDLFTPAEHRDAMNRFLATTGATDHPALFRFLLNVAKKFDEPQGGPPPGPKPPSARTQLGPAPVGGGSKLGYTHPRGGQKN